MADKEVLDALMDVFKSANYRFLTLKEVTQQLQRRGVYQDVELHKAGARVIDHLCNDRASAIYPFCEIDRGHEILWGLDWWIPKPRRRVRDNIHTIEPLSMGWKTQHVLSPDGFEIATGTIPLSRPSADRLFATMNEQQREHPIVELRCYGSEKLLCILTHDDRDNWILESKALWRWYKENGAEPGDVIWLTVEETIPLVLRIYTEWDRDVDAYRRYEQRRKLETLPSIDLPIRDLLWLYFKRAQKIAHRSEIAKAVLAERPEISEGSIDACLSANPHLFARAGQRGIWGLREWGIEQVAIYEPRKGDDPWTVTYADRPKVVVPFDYVLENIAAEGLVYKVLRGAKTSLSYSQIAEKISKYFGVDRNILIRMSFLDPQDSRLARLHDGTFALRENLEEVISELTENEKEYKKSLARTVEEIDKLQDELIYAVSRYEAEISRVEHERNEARHVAREWFGRHAQLGLVVSKFMAEIVSNVGHPTLQLVFDRLRRKSTQSYVEKDPQ